MKITVPPHINAAGLLPFVAALDVRLEAREPIALDFSGLRRVTPAGLAALVATVGRWRKQQHPVSFEGLTACAITGYLQRMDVLRLCGIELPETFQRHEARGRFVPVRLIDHRVDEMGTDLATCLAPGGEDYEHPLADLHSLAWFVFTETANNVLQHSHGTGYVAAQVSRNEGLVRLAIADNGRGILRSFQDAGLAWSKGMRDGPAILRALEPEVSSRGGPINRGVGLTLVSGLVREIKGWMMIVSGTGVLRIRPGRAPELLELPGESRYLGTILGLTFSQTCVRDYAGLLEHVKITAGGLPPAEGGIKFRS